MRQRRNLYQRVAGVEFNDVQVTDSRSVRRSWRNLPSSSGLVETKDHYQKGRRSPWVLMQPGRTLYRREAGVKPSNVQVTDPRSAEQLWRNLPSRSGIASIPSQPSQDPTPEQMAISWVLMRQRRNLYQRVAGVEPNDVQVTDSTSVQRL